MARDRDELVGKRIRQGLSKRDLRSSDLASMLGRKPALVSHWLTGRRTCPPDLLTEIANILKVNRSWLAGGQGKPEGTHVMESTNMASRKSSAPTNEGWWFRPAPADGGRDFGNANIFATPPDIPTLVRELGQNSSDAAQRIGSSPARVHMRYALIELTKGSSQYDKFLNVIDFPRLRAHIERAGQGRARVSAKLRDGLRRIDSEESLFLLRADDYGTIGLPGEELDPTADDEGQRSSPYAALVRNNLDNWKQTSLDGGSFGLGKAVLWNCSDLSTVLFASRIPGEARGMRVVGRTELTWHAWGGRQWAGPGWFGTAELGHSLWINESEFLRELQLDRESTLPPGVDVHAVGGTSALVLAFKDPEAEARPDINTLMTEISRAAAENFFPAIISDRLRVRVEHLVDGQLRSAVDVDPDRFVPEFCDSLRKHRAGEVTEELERPGEVTRKVITLRVPGTREDAEGLEPYTTEMSAQCYLLVRLDENEAEGADPKLANTVAMVRGRNMVTQYLNRDGVAMGARTFHAILLAGDAAGTDPGQLAAEQFLRLAEPPAHSDWSYQPALKVNFKPGSKQRLKDLKDDITKALREAVKPEVVAEDEGPEELRRLLQFGKTPPPPAPTATLRSIRPRLIEGAWLVDAEVNFNDKRKRLRITPRAWIDVESGSAIPLPWAELTIKRGREWVPVDGSFEAGPNSRAVAFQGKTLTEAEGIIAAQCRAKLDLSVEELEEVG
jgi:transcriptional regulator with XRE-family HTH domain